MSSLIVFDEETSTRSKHHKYCIALCCKNKNWRSQESISNILLEIYTIYVLGRLDRFEYCWTQRNKLKSSRLGDAVLVNWHLKAKIYWIARLQGDWQTGQEDPASQQPMRTVLTVTPSAATALGRAIRRHTVRRRLRQHGIRAYRPLRRTTLTKKHQLHVGHVKLNLSNACSFMMTADSSCPEPTWEYGSTDVTREHHTSQSFNERIVYALREKWRASFDDDLDA